MWEGVVYISFGVGGGGKLLNLVPGVKMDDFCYAVRTSNIFEIVDSA
jgi:hypothetical protein